MSLYCMYVIYITNGCLKTQLWSVKLHSLRLTLHTKDLYTIHSFISWKTVIRHVTRRPTSRPFNLETSDVIYCSTIIITTITITCSLPSVNVQSWVTHHTTISTIHITTFSSHAIIRMLYCSMKGHEKLFPCSASMSSKYFSFLFTSSGFYWYCFS